MMQQISGTGIKRDVVREGDGPDRAAVVRGYRGHGGVYDADDNDRLEAAYVLKLEVAVGDRTTDLQRMQQTSRGGGGGVVRDLVEERSCRRSTAGPARATN